MGDYDRIAGVIRYLDAHRAEQPGLDELAECVGLSPFHFHRMFARWVGVTPKSFLQCLTLEHAREALRAGSSVLDAALDAGLSGPGRLHDLCVGLDAASPGEVKSGGGGWTIRAGHAESPFGSCLVGESPRGICHLSFVESADRAAGTAAIRNDWPRARVDWSLDADSLIERIFAPCAGAGPDAPLRAFVRGTPFQVRVWRALLRLPLGALTSYGSLAAALGHPGAARAVGTAVGQNRLGFLIPCHRVIRETGAVTGYRWGTTRKRAMVAWEAATASSRPLPTAAHPPLRQASAVCAAPRADRAARSRG